MNMMNWDAPQNGDIVPLAEAEVCELVDELVWPAINKAWGSDFADAPIGASWDVTRKLPNLHVTLFFQKYLLPISEEESITESTVYISVEKPATPELAEGIWSAFLATLTEEERFDVRDEPYNAWGIQDFYMKKTRPGKIEHDDYFELHDDEDEVFWSDDMVKTLKENLLSAEEEERFAELCGDDAEVQVTVVDRQTIFEALGFLGLLPD